jgi:tetratricopeptide (TPR) repeat protein
MPSVIRPTVTFALVLSLLPASPRLLLAGESVTSPCALLSEQGRQNEALACFETLEVQARKAGSTLEVARIFSEEGLVLFRLDRNRESLARYQQAIDLAARIGNLWLLSQALNNQGLTYERLGDTRRSFVSYFQAHTAARQARGGALTPLYASDSNLVNAYQRLGNYYPATDLVEALERAEPGAPMDAAHTVLQYMHAKVHLRFDQFWDAEPLFVQALAAFREQGNQRMQGYVMIALARVQRWWYGDWQQASVYLDSAAHLFQQLGDRDGLWAVGQERVASAYETGQLTQAEAYLEQAWQVGRSIDAPDINQAARSRLSANLALSRDELAVAVEHARAALRGYRSAGNEAGQAGVYLMLAGLLRETEAALALDMWEHAARIYAGLEDYDNLVGCFEWLAVAYAGWGREADARQALLQARAYLAATVSHRTGIHYDLAEAEVGALSCHTIDYLIAIERAQATADRLGDRWMSALVIAPTKQRLEGLCAPAPAKPGATSAAPANPIALAPVSAATVVAAGQRARYRFLLSSQLDRSQQVTVWLGPARHELPVAAPAGALHFEYDGAEQKSSPAQVVDLSAFERVPIFVDVIAPGAQGNAAVQMWAATEAMLLPTPAFFMARFVKSGSQADLMGRGAEGDTLVNGVDFYHEFKSERAADRSFNLRVIPSAPCTVEVTDLLHNELLALDGDGNGSFSDPADFIKTDSDGDSLPNLPPTEAGAAFPFLVTVYADGPLAADLTVAVQILDERGQSVAVRHDVVFHE